VRESWNWDSQGTNHGAGQKKNKTEEIKKGEQPL